MLHDGEWSGETAIIIGGGPSVGLHDLRELQGRGRIIAINRALELPVVPDMWTWLDDRIWMWALQGQLPDLYNAILSYAGLKVTRLVSKEKKELAVPPAVLARIERMRGDRVLVDNMYPDDVIFIPYGTMYRIGESIATRVNAANNTGFWAINLAYCLGVSKMLLLGFDCNHNGKDPVNDSVEWHHDGYPEFINCASTDTYAKYFKDIAPELESAGVQVINASPLTALNCWPVATTLAQAFERLDI